MRREDPRKTGRTMLRPDRERGRAGEGRLPVRGGAPYEHCPMRLLIIEDDREAVAYLVKAFREAGHVA